MTDQGEKTSEIAETDESTAQSVGDAVQEALEELRAEEAEQVETPAETPAEETQAEAPEQVEPAQVSAPEWWGGDVEVWNGLSPETQEILEGRELAHQKAMEQATVPDAVRSVVGRIGEHAQMYGLTADQALDRLYQAQRLLETNPKHALAQLAKQYGVDPAQLGVTPTGDDQTQQADNPLAAVDQLVNARLAEFQQGLEAQQVQSALSELETWAQEKDDSGNLLRPHFEELQGLVKTEMDRLLEANPRQDRWSALDKAYKTVERIKAPATDMDAEIERRAQEKADALFKAQQVEVAKAKKAAVSPRSSASGSATDRTDTPETVEDAVRQSWNELSSGDAARI